MRRLQRTYILLISLGLLWFLLQTFYAAIIPTTPNQDVTTFSRSGNSTVLFLGRNVPQTVISQSSPFAPILDIIPSQDGSELFISAQNTNKLTGDLFVNIGTGPGHRKGSYTMTYSETVDAYIATVAGFTPSISTFAPLNITTTEGAGTGFVEFSREFVPSFTTQTINSVDGNLELTFVNTDTIQFDTYVVIVPSYAPPGPLPLGYHFVGNVYSVRAPGTFLFTDKPMNLRIYYNDTLLLGAAPHTLAIVAWEPANKQWKTIGGKLFYDQHFLSIPTNRFTTYALVSMPAWHDDFSDLRGLDLTKTNNINGQIEDQKLILTHTPGSGKVVSKVITLSSSLAYWDSLAFTSVLSPPTTTLSIDILSNDGSILKTNITHTTTLTDIDPQHYSSLRLQANLTSTTVGETPSLNEWSLVWRIMQNTYLPVVIK